MNQPQPHSLGLLTSGGDAPGMNSYIRAAAQTAAFHGARIIGALAEGHRDMLTALQDRTIELVPLANASANKQPADLECYHMARMLAR